MSQLANRIELADGYSISRVITGCWQLAEGHGGSSTRGLEKRLSRLVEHGFTTFDCADIYTGVEEALGGFLKTLQDPTAVQIHTKYVPDLVNLPTLSRAAVESAIDRSLLRLRVECLDLVQFHWWNYGVPGYVETFLWLDELRQAGKIRHLGVTNFDTRRLREILDAGTRVVSNQVQYSLVDRRPEGPMAALADEHGFHLLCYGSLAGGFMTDSYRDHESPPAKPLTNRSLTKYRLVIEELKSRSGDGERGWAAFQELLAEVSSVAEEYGMTTARLASRWVLERPAVAAVILGIGSRDRIDERLALQNSQSFLEIGTALDRILARYESIPGAVFELEREPDGPHTALLKMNLGASSDS